MRTRGRGRFRNLPGDAGIADNVDIGHEFRGKAGGIDRAPAGIVGGPGDLGDAPGLVRRDHACDIGDVIAEVGDDGAGRGIDRRHSSALRERNPLDHARIELLPRGLEQLLLRKTVLGIEDQDF